MLIVGASATAQAGGGKVSGARASGVTLASSQSGPVVRDPGAKALPATRVRLGVDGQVRDHRSGHQFCIGGFLGGTYCLQL